jgi:hypothetical protein
MRKLVFELFKIDEKSINWFEIDEYVSFSSEKNTALMFIITLWSIFKWISCDEVIDDIISIISFA